MKMLLLLKIILILPHISFQQINGNLKESRFNSVIKIGTPSFLKKIKGKVFNLSQGEAVIIIFILFLI